jgi:pimeloyl-ACP methyl ester carboxylesterase
VGKRDWGSFQKPGTVENMERICRDFRGARYIEGAGHWIPQGRPQETVEEILGLINTI